MSLDPPHEPGSLRECGERAGVEEGSCVSVQHVDALRSGEVVPIEAVEGDVVGEAAVEGQLHREGGGGEPVGGDANRGAGNGDHRANVGRVGVPDVGRGSRDVEGCVGGQDRRQGLDVSPLGAVDVGPAAFGGRVGGSNLHANLVLPTGKSR